VSSRNPLPFFAPHDITTDDRQVICTQLTDAELARLGWRAMRALKYLESVPIIP
jgi:hypothetical protein